MILVKLGGSAITDKTRPFTYREDVVASVGKAISHAGEQVVLVHGGGSYGHAVASEYGLSSGRFSGAEGVSETRAAMYELNGLVCSSLIKAGVSPYSFSPFDMVSRSGEKAARRWLLRLLRSGMTPVTFGDVSSDPKGFRVLSGDTVMRHLAHLLRPGRCVFAMDVDGVYGDDASQVLPEISASRFKLRTSGSTSNDATGGIRLKLDVARQIVRLGIPVSFVSGLKTSEFAKALKGRPFHGTVVKT